MSREKQILNILFIFIYLWIIGTLPLHHHDHTNVNHQAHTCEHEHHEQHTDDEDCIICFNLFVPQAVDYIDICSHTIHVSDYTPVYKSLKPQYWYNVERNLNLNKGPPVTFIS